MPLLKIRIQEFDGVNETLKSILNIIRTNVFR